MTVRRKILQPGDIKVPALRRGIEPFPVQDNEGTVFIGLRDSLKLSRQEIYLPQDLFYLLQYLDGRNDMLDLRSKYMHRFGQFLFQERLQELITALDENFYFDNEKSRQQIQQQTEIFRKQGVRNPVCAGVSYAAEPEDLSRELDKYDQNSSGRVLQDKDICAVIAPHIDPRLGGPVYTPVYQTLRNSRPADLYVILGIGHQGISQYFALTKMGFETPLGTVQTAGVLVDKLNEYSDCDFTLDELVHRDEHSIEFQVVMLKHFIPSSFRILPILCSFSQDMLQEMPDYFTAFTGALKSVLESYPGRICLIAGIDFAHVGPRYGDDFPPTPAFLAEVERNDRDLLRACAEWNPQQLQTIMRNADDKYRVCGYSALTTMMTVLPPLRGALLDYGSAEMDDKRSTVTFAGMVFY
ncbi:AmmeMemoRadiSam system protein B [candidate division KSB1 bacterium]|nr:AmmeMemoRadiSam system protein B [candidate division KSB1 bacterium]